MALIEKILDVRFTIVRLKSWDEILRRIQSKEIDIIGAATETLSRSKIMTFTKPHFIFPGVFVARKDVEGIFTFEGLKHKKVAVVSGYVWQEFIQRDHPDFELYLVPDVLTGLRQVSSGAIDVLVGNLASVSYHIVNEGIVDLRVAGRTGYRTSLAMAIRKDWPLMKSILSKAMARIPETKKEKILRVWVSQEQGIWYLAGNFLGGFIVIFGIAAFVSVDKYVHERIKSQEAIEHSKDMIARADKLTSLGTLTAGAAHEILNPANIIGMHAQRLIRTNEEGSKEYKSAKVIYESVGRINRICDDLRRFSRDEPTAFKPFNPNDVVQKSLNLLSHELRLGDIQVELNIEIENQELSGDPNQMQQVLFNLIGNAKDAMPSGGNLIITTTELIDGNRKWWECRVMDTGAGIPADIMPKLFDPFFTTKSEDEGTGLAFRSLMG